MILAADQLSAVGKSQGALDEVVEFGERALHSYERVGKSSDFGRFASDRVRAIASNAMLKTAVVSQVAAGVADGLDTEALVKVCDRLGVSI